MDSMKICIFEKGVRRILWSACFSSVSIKTRSMSNPSIGTNILY